MKTLEILRERLTRVRTTLSTRVAHKHDWGRLQHKISVVVPERMRNVFNVGPLALTFSQSVHCAWSTVGHEFFFARNGLRLDIHIWGLPQCGIGFYWDRCTDVFTPEEEVEIRPDVRTPR